MYCANSGHKMVWADFRCSDCRHFSITFWLTLFNVVAWLVIVATNCGFAALIPFLATFCAGFGVYLPRIMLLNVFWSNFLWTYGVLLVVVALILVGPLVRSFGRSPRLGRVMTGFSCLALVIMATIVVADGRFLHSFCLGLEEGFGQIEVRRAELSARDSTRSVIIAEYRYRDLHPKVGFTCDLESLETVGGPRKARTAGQTPRESNTVSIDVYKLSLRGCPRAPVTKYEVAAVPDRSFGGLYEKAAAYCSDGSGALYSAADGKSETCLTARTLAH